MDKRILVIDDEDAIRKSFVLALEDTEYQVDTAESGEEGIEKGKEDNYDLIFLDLKMPGMNGIDTLRGLREFDNETPIYIITAFHEEFLQELKRARDGGIGFELLRKPISSDQIVVTAKNILEGHAGHQEDDEVHKYELKLYMVGETQQSERLLNDLTQILDKELEGKYSLEVIDVLENPRMALNDNILATPTLAKIYPPPVKKVIGDLSHKETLLEELGFTKV